ncbi:MAG: dihydropteroate synthase [Phycisphaerales bacterium]|nr:dihydropteroate synthase [Phycisphaerales bacterium]
MTRDVSSPKSVNNTGISNFLTHFRPSSLRDWRIASHAPLSFTKRPLLAGILNCTPDSFSDGGQFATTDQAIAHGKRMIEQGADMLDIGGESTRPGATRVSAAEQIHRVQPVIRALRQHSAIPISVDTTLGPVAAAALDAGANIVNDVSAGEEDPDLVRLAAKHGAGLILMHRLCAPDQDQYSDQYISAPQYNNVTHEVLEKLLLLAQRANMLGVAREHIVIDPGFGFGKTVAQNFELLQRLHEIAASEFPVMVGLSRKSFLGAARDGNQPSERLPASLAAAAVAIGQGAAILRVHDVAEHGQLLRISAACGAC